MAVSIGKMDKDDKSRSTWGFGVEESYPRIDFTKLIDGCASQEDTLPRS
jgi:hypothetical protein